MTNHIPHDKEHFRIGHELILDEIFDLTLYEKLRRRAQGELAVMLDTLIATERKHVSFWYDFFQSPPLSLNQTRRIKQWCIVLLVTLSGNRLAHPIIEAIEIHGIRKYLSAWETYRTTPLKNAIERILQDEFEHESMIVQAEAKEGILPQRIRNIFLGFNDGLVEIIGAVSGFFAAFASTTSVLAASMTVAIAGAFSMAAGAFVALGSEAEVEETQRLKHQFLEGTRAEPTRTRPFKAGITVGISYLLGASVPVLPVFFGATNLTLSLISSAVMVSLVSAILAFLSGMEVRKRVLLNLGIIALAISVTYLIGTAAKTMLGVSI